MAKSCTEDGRIAPELYDLYEVNRGLRDLNGKGVLTGLTEISEVNGKKLIDGKLTPCDGELFYRGYNIKDIVKGFVEDDRFGFEETVYLLLFGKLPNQKEGEDFAKLLSGYRSLPSTFFRDVIMKSPSSDIMNAMSRCVLMLYSYDKNPDDTSIANVLRQCLQLIASFPLLAVYSYQAYLYYKTDYKSFIIHDPDPKLSTAENILYMLRPDSSYTKLEARLLDLALVIHAEHGGGNNSTFTTHVVTSSGTDTYSAISAALCSLKGPKHGGANIKVCDMFEDIKANVADWDNEDEVAQYLKKLLHKEAFDRSGLIYGIGHAIYSLSDPRAELFKGFVKMLAAEKGLEKEFRLYENVERLAPVVIREERRIYKGVSANVDFYSGFVYQMLGLPRELYTPLFAVARIAGWSAHRIEELINGNRIIRPAYMAVKEQREYLPLEQRG